mmetsp:Transcript_70192/g.209209  ORF Transcript_70192/g.209209 Transcript_70192/m.209209 type:complete len:102 (-) Transcript_70192:263-568(-)
MARLRQPLRLVDVATLSDKDIVNHEVKVAALLLQHPQGIIRDDFYPELVQAEVGARCRHNFRVDFHADNVGIRSESAKDSSCASASEAENEDLFARALGQG